MTLGSVLVEVAVVVVGSGFAAPLSSWIKRFILSREQIVAVRLPSGKEVRLDLDSRLSSDTVSALVADAVRSAKSGDEQAIRQTVEASHAASQRVRAMRAD